MPATDCCTAVLAVVQNSETNADAFEDGQHDVFSFKDLDWIGELAKIQVGHDGRGFKSGWLLDHVEIIEVRTHAHTQARTHAHTHSRTHAHMGARAHGRTGARTHTCSFAHSLTCAMSSSEAVWSSGDDKAQMGMQVRRDD